MNREQLRDFQITHLEYSERKYTFISDLYPYQFDYNYYLIFKTSKYFVVSGRIGAEDIAFFEFPFLSVGSIPLTYKNW